MKRILSVLMVAIPFSFAYAAEAPPLPKAAKKLKSAEIELLYNDKAMQGEYYGAKSLIKWKSMVSSAGRTVTGTWEDADGNKGEVDLTYAIKKNRWCTTRKGNKEFCSEVYTDDTYGYEVSKGKVMSRFALTP